jgi:hypothetical protein
VHLRPEGEDSASEHDEETEAGEPKWSRRGRLRRAINRIFGTAPIQETEAGNTASANGDVQNNSSAYVSAHTEGFRSAPVHKLRTLQRYHGGPNQERMAFMEAKSALTEKNLAVCAEQVSIFLTSGSSKSSFFVDNHL